MSEVLDRRIAQLESELTGLRRQKLTELQAQLSALQKSLDSAGEASVGGSARSGAKRRGRPPKSSKGWAASLEAATSAPSTRLRKKRGRKRGNHVPDEEAIAALKKIVAGAGKAGVSARQASQASGIFYPRAIKLMPANFKKSGSGKWTRYTV